MCQDGKAESAVRALWGQVTARGTYQRLGLVANAFLPIAATGTTTDMRAAFLLLLLWPVACAHPVPGHEPARSRRSAQQQDTANEDYINNLGNLLDDGDGRHPPATGETGDNALAWDPAVGNAVGEELGEHGGQDKRGRAGEAQHLNQVDHEGASARDGNSLGFLEEDARDADDGDNGEHHGTGVNGLPSQAGGLLDEEDDSGDDTFDQNGQEDGGEGPTYMAGPDGAGELDHDAGRGDTGAGGGHGDSSSSSSSESMGADHRQYRNYLGGQYERTYRHRGGSSSSQEEEESYNFADEAMQGDDPSVFDGPVSSYKGRRAGPHALGSSWGAGSHQWEEGDSRSPEVEDADSEEDSPSTEGNSQSEEPDTSQSEENSASRSREDGDGEDSPSREDEDSESKESTADQSDEEPGESPEDISKEALSTSGEHSSSRSREEQEDQESAEDKSAPSTPDSESREDDGDQSPSTEDTAEESKEDENDSNPDGDVPSTSTESQSASPEDDGSQEDDAGEDSRSTESNNSESQEEDDDEESHSQEDATHESSSRGDNSSPQSLESGSRKRRLGAYRNKPAADSDDNDCQDGY
ncbi:dentin matrix acidic phosphoprotein 1-like [Strigops habroptila]|uniref:dentin matrix acidic phosphoprotein 1-like n=1 Tax=Strigops habroptila TaxID=2489341 RepID=UPI0011CEE6F7|nr:dentin matrix acidic phosphoprotein 1-like [Strigops habroptila]